VAEFVDAVAAAATASSKDAAATFTVQASVATATASSAGAGVTAGEVSVTASAAATGTGNSQDASVTAGAVSSDAAYAAADTSSLDAGVTAGPVSCDASLASATASSLDADETPGGVSATASLASADAFSLSLFSHQSNENAIRHPVEADTIGIWRCDEVRSDAYFPDAGPRCHVLGQSDSPPVIQGLFSADPGCGARQCGRGTGQNYVGYRAQKSWHPDFALQSLTFCGWINVTQWTGYLTYPRIIAGFSYQFLDPDTAFSYGFRLGGDYHSSTLTAEVRLDGSPGADEVLQANFDSLPLGWSYIGMTWDGYYLRLYWDSILVDRVHSASDLTVLKYSTSGLFYIGAQKNSFCGRQEDFALYNSVKHEDWFAGVYLGTLEVTPDPDPPPSIQHPITADCVACYRLDEASDTDDAVDATGNGHTGTAMNSPDVVADGKFDGGRAVDANSVYFDISNITGLDITNSLTVCAWVRPVTSSPQEWPDGAYVQRVHTWYMAGLVSCHSWRLGFDSYSLRPRFAAMVYTAGCSIPGNGTFISAASSWDIPVGVWSHVVGVYDGTYIYIYVNGQLHVRTLNTTGYNNIIYSTEHMLLGGVLAAHVEIDDVAIYNTVKSPEWIYDIYWQAAMPDLAGYLPIDDTTIGCYRMDCGEYCPGAAELDASGNERHMSAYESPRSGTGSHGSARHLSPIVGSSGSRFLTQHDAAWIPSGGLTIAAYVNRMQHTSGYIVRKEGSWSLGLESLWVHQPYFTVVVHGTTLTVRAANDYELPIGEWHLLVAVYDGLQLRIYDNYQLIASLNNTTGYTDITTSSTSVQIGEGLFGLWALVDEVAVYASPKAVEFFDSASPPYVTPLDPGTRQTRVVVASDITFQVRDNTGSIVDGWLAYVKRNAYTDWELAFEHNGIPQFKPGWQGPRSALSVITNGYELTLDPEISFDLDAVVAVRVTAYDDQGNLAKLG